MTDQPAERDSTAQRIRAIADTARTFWEVGADMLDAIAGDVDDAKKFYSEQIIKIGCELAETQARVVELEHHLKAERSCLKDTRDQLDDAQISIHRKKLCIESKGQVITEVTNECIKLQARVVELEAFAKDCDSNYDCDDLSAHQDHDAQCRKCKARAVLGEE